MKNTFLKIVLVCCLAMCIVGVIPNKAYADTPRSVTEYNSLTIQEDIIEYVYGENVEQKLRVDRTAGSDGEKAACEYIADKFQSYGYEAYFENYRQEFSAAYALGKKITSSNVAGLKRSATDTGDFIVIGAHVDNTYNFEGDDGNAIHSHGVYDNASGMVAMLNIARMLATVELDYNVIFVAFGAEELGNLGSQAFVASLSKEVKDNLLLMINFDSIGCGDNMYMYADEVHTVHEDYFREIADTYVSQFSQEAILEAPTFKKATYDSYAGQIEYSHMGLSSDNGMFVGYGYNAVTFFSGAWNDMTKTGISESSTLSQTFHTADDNITSINEKYGDKFYTRIEEVIGITMNVLTQEDFVEQMRSSNNKFNYLFFTTTSWISLICAGAIVILYVCCKSRARKFVPKIDSNDSVKKALLDNDYDKLQEELSKGRYPDIEKDYNTDIAKSIDTNNDDKK